MKKSKDSPMKAKTNERSSRFPTKRLGFLLPSLLMLGWACGSVPEKEGQDPEPAQAQIWLQKPKSPFLLDVRMPEEYAQEHIAGAKLIPLPELEKRLAEVPRDRPLLVYCHSGRRSRKALDLLKEKGYSDLHHIAGGITAWKEKGFAVEQGPATKP